MKLKLQYLKLKLFVQLPYSASIESSDTVALHKPSLSIRGNGSIPTEAQTFEIHLPCTGFRSTEVNVEFTLNVTANPKFRANDITTILLKRKKICLEGRPGQNSHIRIVISLG